MNRVKRRVHELKTGVVKERRLVLHPYDINLEVRGKDKLFPDSERRVLKWLQSFGLVRY